VLVERVEGLCSVEAWKRAYREIVQFERDLVNFGAILFKFWMHVSSDEQLRRFQERETNELKKWKLTAEDWRNRSKWDAYFEATDEMLTKTSTLSAPWTVVEANDKYHARVKVLKTLVDKLSDELNYDALKEVFPHDHKNKNRAKKK
jgi:polyphosphate kinase 2 (PPK2 family)